VLYIKEAAALLELVPEDAAQNIIFHVQGHLPSELRNQFNSGMTDLQKFNLLWSNLVCLFSSMLSNFVSSYVGRVPRSALL